MPHTTSSDVVSPTLGTIPTADVWDDDPRSLTTFRTFHQSNGNSNGSISETSFLTPAGTNGTQQNGTHESAEQKNGVQSLYSVPNEYLLKNKLGNSKLKGLVLNQVKPVTPPQTYKEVVKFDKNLVSDRIKPSNSFSKSGFYLKPFSASSPDSVSEQNSDDASEKNKSLPGNGIHVTENGSDDVSSAEEYHESKSDLDIVTIDLGPTDKRFGFSVVGGCDEGFLPRIENITPENNGKESPELPVSLDP